MPICIVTPVDRVRPTFARAGHSNIRTENGLYHFEGCANFSITAHRPDHFERIIEIGNRGDFQSSTLKILNTEFAIDEVIDAQVLPKSSDRTRRLRDACAGARRGP